MNNFNPRKLAMSKWTACQPVNREKHFLVTELICDEDGTPLQIELQAVYTGRKQLLDWREVRNSLRWKIGWC